MVCIARGVCDNRACHSPAYGGREVGNDLRLVSSLQNGLKTLPANAVNFVVQTMGRQAKERLLPIP